MSNENKRDFWDKFSIVSNISVAISVALIGSLFTWHSDILKTTNEAAKAQRKHQIEQLNVLYKYFPHLSSGSEDEKRISLIMIHVLNPELFKNLTASMSPSPGIDGAIYSVAQSVPNDKDIQHMLELVEERNALQLSVSQLPDTEINKRATAAVSYAIAELNKNVVESPEGSNRSLEIDKYWGDTGIIGQPWNMAFVSYCLSQTKNWEKYSKKYHLSVLSFWKEANSKGWSVNKPESGDIFIMIKSQSRGTGHVGFIQRVEGDTLFTIEGNSGNRLKANKRKLSTVNHFVRVPSGDEYK